MNKLIIHIKNGLVQEMYADTENINITVYDFDNDDKSEEEVKSLEKDFESDIKNMFCLY